MKRLIILSLLFFLITDIFSQEKIDTVISCCQNDTLFLNSEEGKPASFPGGEPVYMRWLYKWMGSKNNEKLLSESHLQGKCQFRFTIDTTGRITNIQFCSMQGTLAETVIRDILDKSPLWEPAISKKRGKVIQQFCQRIDFQFGELDN